MGLRAISSVNLPRLLRGVICCGVLVFGGCSRGRGALSRQPIQLTPMQGEVVAGGRLVFQARRQGRPDPGLRWEASDPGVGALLEGGVLLAGRTPGVFRIRVYDPDSGQQVQAQVRVVMDPGEEGDPGCAELYDYEKVRDVRVQRMRRGRIGHAACLLADGRVLMTGGVERPGGKPHSDAELFDPASGRFLPSLATGLPREGHTLTLLLDKDVLVLGGVPGRGAAERYDPALDQCFSLEDCPAANGPHQTLLLGSGGVLVVGFGVDLFDPRTNTFRRISEEPAGLQGCALTETGADQVVITGGTRDASTPLSEVWLVDLRTGSCAPKGSMQFPRAWHGAHLMPGGMLRLYGGTEGKDMVEDLDLQTWRATAQRALEPPMGRGAKVQLPDGRLVVMGGRMEASKDVHLVLPVGGVVTPLKQMTQSRRGHSLTLMKDGRILVAGGYDPALLQNTRRSGARP